MCTYQIRNPRIIPSKGWEQPQARVIFDFINPKTGNEITDHELFRFYDDEINFRPEELDGKTVEEAMELFTRKDTAYLRS